MLIRSIAALIFSNWGQDQKNLFAVLIGIGGIIFWWVFIYTGFWIASGFRDKEKKDEKNGKSSSFMVETIFL